MVDRQRVRVGRDVSYNPTAAEVTASGVGPWPGKISDVNVDGSIDLAVIPPGDALGVVGAALADPLITTADFTVIAATDLAAQAAAASTQTAAADVGVFTDPPSAAEMAILRTLVNESKADYNAAQLEIAELITLYAATLTMANEIKVDFNLMRTLVLELKVDLNVATTLINQLRGLDANTQIPAVTRGQAAGQFDFVGAGTGSSSV